MSPIIIWSGPVSTSNLDGVDFPPGTIIITENYGPDGGIGSSSFGQLGAYAESIGDGDAVRGILSLHKLRPEDHGPITAAGFSAFHGLASYLAKSPHLSALVLLDACFSAFGSLKKPSFVSFGEKAVAGDTLMVFSSSNGGGQDYSTGTACARANYEASGGIVSGNEPLPVESPGASGSRTGNLIWLDYGSSFADSKYGQHGAHVHVLGDAILNRYMVPWMSGERSSPRGGGSPSPGTRRSGGGSSAAVMAALAIAVGIGGGIALRSWRSSA